MYTNEPVPGNRFMIIALIFNTQNIIFSNCSSTSLGFIVNQTKSILAQVALKNNKD